MARRRRWWRWGIGVVLLYTIGGFLLAPLIVRPILVAQLKNKLHRDAAVASVHLNPYALSVTIDGLRVNEPGSTNRFVGWDRLHVNLQLSSLYHRALVLRELSLSNAFAHVTLNADRSLNFADLIPPPSTNPPSPPPTVRIGKLDITGAQLIAEDHSRRHPFATTIGPVNVALHNFSTQPDNQNPYSFSATTESGERFAWRGHFHLDPIRSDGEFVIEQIALAKYTPYLDQFPNLHVRDGRLGVRGNYRVSLAANATVAILSNATVTLENLRLAHRAATTDAVSIARLTIRDIVADATAMQAEIGEVSLAGERLHVVVTTNRTVNLVTLFQTAPTTNPAPAGPAPRIAVTVHNIRSDDGGVDITGLYGDQTIRWQTTALTNLVVQTTPLRASVATLTVTNAAITFADDTVTPPARLAVQQINQTITGFSLAPDSETQLRVTAKVNNVAPVTITGALTPLTLARAACSIVFQDISLLPLDPYFGKYLGYRLDSGSVGLNLNYAVTNRQLTAGNVIVVDQMNLGAATDSPDALKLPIKLGLAILKDRHGVIKLDVPITGNLDDPQFHLRTVILTTFKNLFLKILTSPFAALGSMFGGGGEELAYQEFQPGRATLQPAEATKLDTLHRALTERPGLTLAIQGAFDPVADLAGLRRVKLDAALTNTTLQALYLANLDKLHATILVTNQAPAETTGFSNIRGLQPRNAPKPVVQAVPTARRDAAHVPPAEMERQLLEIMEVTAADLNQLAEARAAAVRAYLIQPGTLDPARLTVTTERKKTGSRAFLTLQ